MVLYILHVLDLVEYEVHHSLTRLHISLGFSPGQQVLQRLHLDRAQCAGSGEDTASSCQSGGDEHRDDDAGWQVALKSQSAARHRRQKETKRDQRVAFFGHATVCIVPVSAPAWGCHSTSSAKLMAASRPPQLLLSAQFQWRTAHKLATVALNHVTRELRAACPKP